MTGLFLLGLTFRLPGLDTCSLWLDEAWRVAVAEAPLQPLFSAPVAWCERIFSFHGLLHLMLGLFGHSEWSVRIIPAVAGALSVPVTYSMGRLALDRLGSVFAALLLCVHPLHISYSQEGAAYTIAGLLTPLFLILCTKLTSRPRPTYLLPSLVAIVMLMGLAFLYQLGLIAAVLSLYAITGPLRRPSPRSLLFISILVASATLLLSRYVPLIGSGMFKLQEIDDWKASFLVRILNSLVSGPINNAHGALGLRDYYAPSVGPNAGSVAKAFAWLALAIGLLVPVRAIALTKMNPHVRIWLYATMAYVLFLLIQPLVTNHAEVRYIVPLLPVIAIFVASLAGSTRRSWRYTGLAALGLLLLHFFMVLKTDPPGSKWKPDVRSIARDIAGQARAGHRTILVNPEVFELPLYEFYLRGTPCRVLRQPAYEDFFHHGDRGIQYRTPEAKTRETEWIREQLLGSGNNAQVVFLVSQRDKARIMELADTLGSTWPQLEKSVVDQVLVVRLWNEADATKP